MPGQVLGIPLRGQRLRGLQGETAPPVDGAEARFAEALCGRAHRCGTHFRITLLLTLAPHFHLIVVVQCSVTQFSINILLNLAPDYPPYCCSSVFSNPVQHQYTNDLAPDYPPYCCSSVFSKLVQHQDIIEYYFIYYQH